jgi:hypothetical protein
MRKLATLACFVLLFNFRANSQADVPKFAVEVRNTFIWGEDVPAGAISSSVREPLTGAEILTLKHDGIAVTSRMGFEKLHPEDAAEFIVYASTIVNNTSTELTVESGGIAIDGHLVSPLSTDSSIKGTKQRHSNGGKDVVNVRSLNCFGSGSLASENFLPAQQNSPAMLVKPQSSLTVSVVVRDPRHYPLLCTAEGCFPKGTIRYSIHVGRHEYIFSWSGHSLMNCGR